MPVSAAVNTSPAIMVKSEAFLLCLIKRLLYVRAATERTASVKTGTVIAATGGMLLVDIVRVCWFSKQLTY
jgi:hypothetical protein